MVLKLVYSIMFTLLPVTGLRVGIPLASSYALQNNIPIFLVFSLIILINILLVFFIFFFLDNLHSKFMEIKIYRKFFEGYLKRLQKRIDRFEKQNSVIGIFALVLFVSIPLPGTGTWSGSIISWVLDLDRKKSILAISLGVFIAGLIILFVFLGLFKVF